MKEMKNAKSAGDGYGQGLAAGKMFKLIFDVNLS